MTSKLVNGILAIPVSDYKGIEFRRDMYFLANRILGTLPVEGYTFGDQVKDLEDELKQLGYQTGLISMDSGYLMLELTFNEWNFSANIKREEFGSKSKYIVELDMSRSRDKPDLDFDSIVPLYYQTILYLSCKFIGLRRLLMSPSPTKMARVVEEGVRWVNSLKLAHVVYE